MNRHLSKEDINGQQVYGKMLNVTNHQGHANCSHFILSRMTITKEKEKKNKDKFCQSCKIANLAVLIRVKSEAAYGK